MKLHVNTPKPFTDAVVWAAKTTPHRPSVPVLAGVRLAAGPDGMTVSAYDYETATTATVDAVVDEPGTVLVSARLLADICKALPAKPISFAAVGAHLEVVCGSARFTLPTMPVEDYPALPGMPDVAGSVDGPSFTTAVQQVAVAASRDDTLPMMTGVRVETDGPRMRLIATDRYRLAVRELDWAPADGVADLQVLIPGSVLAGTAKVLVGPDRISVAHTAGQGGEGVVGLHVPGRQCTSRLLDGANYPPVLSLFPTQVTSSATVDVAALSEVVRRVALVAERTTPVLLSFSADGLVVEAGGSEDARASEAMPAAFTGEALTTGFNPAYLVDGLSALGAATVQFRFVDAFKPAVLVGMDGDTPDESYRYLLMPIRVTK